MTDIAAGKVPVLKCFEQAWRFLFEHWRLFAPAAIVPAIGNGLAVALRPASTGTSLTGEFVVGVVAAIATVFFAAAVLRKAVRDEFVPPWGLAAGQDEMRLFGVLAYFVAIFVLPLALAAAAFDTFVLRRIASTPEALNELRADPEAFNKAVLEALGESGLLLLDVFVVVALVLMVVGFVALIRFSVANAATVGERRLMFFQVWGWSSGNVLRMMAALVLTALPAFFVNLIVAALIASLASAGPVPVQMLAGAAVGFAEALLSIPSIALGAILYKGLRPPNFGAT